MARRKRPKQTKQARRVQRTAAIPAASVATSRGTRRFGLVVFAGFVAVLSIGVISYVIRTQVAPGPSPSVAVSEHVGGLGRSLLDGFN